MQIKPRKRGLPRCFLRVSVRRNTECWEKFRGVGLIFRQVLFVRNHSTASPVGSSAVLSAKASPPTGLWSQ